MDQTNSPSLEGFSQRYRDEMKALCEQHARPDLIAAFSGKFSLNYAKKIFAGTATVPLPPAPGAAPKGQPSAPPAPAKPAFSMVDNMRQILRSQGITPADEVAR